MALGRDHERDLAAGAGALLDLLEQPRRRLRAVCDDKQPPGWGSAMGYHSAPRRPAHHPDRMKPIIRFG